MNATDVFYNVPVTFSWFDYGLFVAMLLLSVLIGLYFGCCGHQDSINEYLLGGKEMSVVPIAISLVARYIKKNSPYLSIYHDPCCLTVIFLELRFWASQPMSTDSEVRTTCMSAC